MCFASANSTSRKRPLGFPAVDKWMDAAAAGALSRADFDPSPTAFKTRAGDVAAIRRRPNGPSERWPGPRMSAETKIAWADHPIGWTGRVGKRLGLGGARLRKDAQRKNSGRERGCGFCHVETLPDREARGVIGRPIVSDIARVSRAPALRRNSSQPIPPSSTLSMSNAIQLQPERIAWHFPRSAEPGASEHSQTSAFTDRRRPRGSDATYDRSRRKASVADRGRKCRKWEGKRAFPVGAEFARSGSSPWPYVRSHLKRAESSAFVR